MQKKQDTHSAIFRGLGDSPSKASGGDAERPGASPDQLPASELAAQATAQGGVVATPAAAEPTLKATKKRWGKGGDKLKKAHSSPEPTKQPEPASVAAPSQPEPEPTPAAAPAPEEQAPAAEPERAPKLEHVVLVQPSEEEKAKKELASSLFAGTAVSTGRTRKVSRARKVSDSPGWHCRDY